jgi:hypothetical protein
MRMGKTPRMLYLLVPLVLLSGLVGRLMADSARIEGTEIVAADTLKVTVAYRYDSDHGTQAALLLRVLPRDLARSFEVLPGLQRVPRSQTEETAAFTVRSTGQGIATVTQVAIGLMEAGRGRQQPLFTETLDVEWRFPLRLEPGGGPITPVSGPKVSLRLPGGTEAAPVDSELTGSRVARLRRFLESVRLTREAMGDVMEDRRTYRLMMLQAAVSQDRAAEQELPVAENVPDAEHPEPGEPGVQEAEEQPVGKPPRPDEPGPPPGKDPQGAPTGPRISRLEVDSIESSRRGTYRINFTYHIDDVANRTPITFDCLFQGDANNHVSVIPWVHGSPERNHTVKAYVVVHINTPDAPLSLGPTPFKLRARGKNGGLIKETQWKPQFAWYKAFDQITRDNIRDYFADPDAPPSMRYVPVNEGADSLAERFHRYQAEPPMLVTKTQEGTYCRGFFAPHQGAQGVEGVWIIELDCFDAHGPGALEGSHILPDTGRYSIRSYDNAGLITTTARFDLDWHGFNCSEEEADLLIGRHPDGTYAVAPLNGCEIKY